MPIWKQHLQHIVSLNKKRQRNYFYYDEYLFQSKIDLLKSINFWFSAKKGFILKFWYRFINVYFWFVSILDISIRNREAKHRLTYLIQNLSGASQIFLNDFEWNAADVLWQSSSPRKRQFFCVLIVLFCFKTVTISFLRIFVIKWLKFLFVPPHFGEPIWWPSTIQGIF
jgi:hypothetical protein